MQAWAIAPKIREIDDLLKPEDQTWVFEVHPEVSFWRLNGRKPMAHRKSRIAGREERRALLLPEFPDLDRHIGYRPSGVAVDDLLDAAVAAWSAMRLWQNRAESVCAPCQDARELRVSIHY